MVRSWAQIKFLSDHPELRREDQVAYEQDGEPVTASQDYTERFTEERNGTASRVTYAFLDWDVNFFRDVAKEMAKVSKESVQWPDMMRVELLKAAYESQPVNLSEVARRLQKHFPASDPDSIKRQLRRFAKLFNIPALPPGRPKK